MVYKWSKYKSGNNVGAGISEIEFDVARNKVIDVPDGVMMT